MAIDRLLNQKISEDRACAIIAVTTQYLQALAVPCSSTEPIQKTSSLFAVHIYDVVYVCLLQIQTGLAVVLGLQARNVIECVADLVGLAEENNYLERALGQEKKQLSRIPPKSNEVIWLARVAQSLKAIENTCVKLGFDFNSLPEKGLREDVLSRHCAELGSRYRFLCLDAHTRIGSAIRLHFSGDSVDVLKPARSHDLEYFADTLMICMHTATSAMCRIWPQSKEWPRAEKEIESALQNLGITTHV